MSTSTTTPAFTTTYGLESKARPDASYVTVTLASEREDGELIFSFATSAHPSEPTQISVIDLIAKCKPDMSPIGFYLDDNRTLELNYRFPGKSTGGTKTDGYIEEMQRDTLADAMRRLRVRLEEQIEEICAARDMSFHRDGQTHLVTPRG